MSTLILLSSPRTSVESIILYIWTRYAKKCQPWANSTLPWPLVNIIRPAHMFIAQFCLLSSEYRRIHWFVVNYNISKKSCILIGWNGSVGDSRNCSASTNLVLSLIPLCVRKKWERVCVQYVSSYLTCITNDQNMWPSMRKPSIMHYLRYKPI